MTDHEEIGALSRSVREEGLEILHDLSEKASAFDLPPLPEGIAQVRNRLATNNYDVVVVGEAKRGKSTFVNALIGQEILPTDVAVATSKVFKVRRAEQEAYRLRFEDGSERPITRAELRLFGSQTEEDIGEVPKLNQMVRWLEVDAPVRFLPEGISLVDTPGLGSLYAAHAEITYRFVPAADAVIFVLDSEQPILRSELDLLTTLLGVTPDIFFILTKIDLYSTEAWQAILRRDEEVLRSEFGERLSDLRIWPISGTNLSKAGQSERHEELYLRISLHRPLAAALQAFLFRVAGWRRTTEALLLAEHAQGLLMRTLGERLSAVTQESLELRNRTQELLTERRRNFESAWGEKGAQRRSLVETTDAVTAAARQSLLQQLQMTGRIATNLLEEIRCIGSLEDARKAGESLSGKVIAAATQAWQQTWDQAYARCIGALAPFQSAADQLLAPDGAASSGLVLRDSISLENEGLWWKKARGGYREAVQATGITGFVGTIVTIAFPVVLPFVAITTLAAGFWGWLKGRKRVELEELESAKRKLQSHLTETLQRVRHHMTEIDFSSGQLKSRVDDQFEGLRRSVLDHVQRVVEVKSRDARAEAEQLAAAAKLEEVQRKARADLLRGQISEFEQLGKRIRETQERLNEIERRFAAAQAVADSPSEAAQ